MKTENMEGGSGGKIVPEKPPVGATDMELALFFATHIDNPCEAEVSENGRKNIRDFYLREARDALWKITNEDAYKFLEAKIDEYEK